MRLQSKQQHADAAQVLAQSFNLVQHNNTLFIPAQWDTFAVSPSPAPEETVWLPLSRSDKRLLANTTSGILFASDAEFNSFDYMLRQFAQAPQVMPTSLFIRTDEGLRVLTEHGTLELPDGNFRANVLKPYLNTDAHLKQRLYDIIVHWVGSEEDARSLLQHLSTALMPHWSAVKYLLLLGEGRNGKSVLLSMLAALFGEENVSNITRQTMAAQSPTCVELNNKLLNIVFDGQMDYIKDSGMEKSLIAGEPGYVRLLYESGTTKVQTNALFIEALNREPKTRDKSTALQKRLVRYRFPHTFDRDIAFEKEMLTEPILGALLALLIDHFVNQDEVQQKLLPTKASEELKVEQMWLNSPVLQFLSHLLESNSDAAEDLVGSELKTFEQSFMAWRLTQGSSTLSRGDLISLMKDCFEIKWLTTRQPGGGFSRKQIIHSIRPETQALINMFQEGDSHAQP